MVPERIVALEVPFAAEAPQPLLRELRPGAEYPVAALGPLRQAVKAVQGKTGAPVALPAASALSIASLAMQGFVDVETLGGSRPVSLYAMTIAKSGERKSSCDAALMAGLRAFEQEAQKAWNLDYASWEIKHALWKGQRESILSEAKKSKGQNRTAAEADLKALGVEPTAPPSPGRIVTEPTFAGLARKYAEGIPSLGIFSDEGGQFLGGYAMSRDNRQSTLAAFNDLWQGNPIQRTRKEEGSYTLYGRRLAIHLMIQPGWSAVRGWAPAELRRSAEPQGNPKCPRATWPPRKPSRYLCGTGDGGA
ncbi:YfjI family protein [Defluviimonas sp. WL0075]|uniref:YfjI family protein n=1 Tax=Albidovulum sediminicola TaxID=2984331 RepID=A0ABT2Z0I1_9RHOB|nr:YfjI family protein [Defluviimonas sp. WL0075]MCV2864591.1 YfjI family protein [Defluviimonas sp. WL0075]